MKAIPLTKGLFAFVDDEDYDRVARHKWYASFRKTQAGRLCVYVQRNARRKRGIWIPIYLHRIIMSARKGEIVDHRNGDGLDNRKSNLRKCTHRENCRNSRLKKNKGFKGVCRLNNRIIHPWIARIRVNQKTLNLGTYATEIEAAKAYDDAAGKYFGLFARTNGNLFGDLDHLKGERRL